MISNNRGDLEIKYVVGLVIAIVVVYVVIIFFMGGVQGLGAKFGLLSEKSSKPVDTFDLSKIISSSGSTASSGTGSGGGSTGGSGSGSGGGSTVQYVLPGVCTVPGIGCETIGGKCITISNLVVCGTDAAHLGVAHSAAGKYACTNANQCCCTT